MKKAIVVFILILLLSIHLGIGNVAAEYLYNEIPFLDFEDISETGTQLNLTDDSHAYILIPFTFTFYSQDYNAISIQSNGAIGFENKTQTFNNRCIPVDTSLDTFIAPFWDDLNPSKGGAVYYEMKGTEPNRRLIVQWDNVPHYRDVDGATFQTILYERTNWIFFQYEDVKFKHSTFDYGGSATIGLQENPTNGIQYSCNEKSLSNGMAIMFTETSYIYDEISFHWNGISLTGTNLNLEDDDNAYISIPFTFTFYSQDYNAISIGSNGRIYFVNQRDYWVNYCIPHDNPDNIDTFIAPFWDDLNPPAGDWYNTGVYYEVKGTAPNRMLIVEWSYVPHYPDSDEISFQAILYEGTNKILFQYDDVDFEDPSCDYGVSATIGLQENIENGLQYSCNTASLSNSMAILFWPITLDREFHVYPGQNIQERINVAHDGDVIFIHPGIYYENNIGIVNKDIRLQSIDPDDPQVVDNTIIDGYQTGTILFIIYVWNPPEKGAVLDGLTLQNGNGSTNYLGFGCVGGGIHCEHTSAMINNCKIIDNIAGDGGGIFCHEASPTIMNCTISRNTADCLGEHEGGGIYCLNNSSPKIINCTITDNTAGYSGGAIWCKYSSSPIITNCTIAGNSAGTMTGGLCSHSSSPIITNCILWNDTSPEISFSGNGVPIVRYTDINQVEYEGINGNIKADPLFVNPAIGDYHLQENSPCIDTGTSDGAPDTDKDGVTRPQDGDCSWTAEWDMGAYEYVRQCY